MRSQFSFTRPARLRLDLAEDMRVPANELRVDAAGDGLEIPVALLRQEKREEVDLEEQIAELVQQLCVVIRERRVGDLVGLLDGVRHDRARRLLPVPGTLATQPFGQQLQLEEGLLQALHPSANCWWSSRRSSSPVLSGV